MELSEAISSGTTRGRLAEVEAKDEQGRKQKKAVIKGSRLTYEKTVAVIGSDGETQNIINYRQYDLNSRAPKGADVGTTEENPHQMLSADETF